MAIIGNVRTVQRCHEHDVDIIFASGLEAGEHIGLGVTMPLVSTRQASGIIITFRLKRLSGTLSKKRGTYVTL